MCEKIFEIPKKRCCCRSGSCSSASFWRFPLYLWCHQKQNFGPKQFLSWNAAATQLRTLFCVVTLGDHWPPTLQANFYRMEKKYSRIWNPIFFYIPKVNRSSCQSFLTYLRFCHQWTCTLASQYKNRQFSIRWYSPTFGSALSHRADQITGNAHIFHLRFTQTEKRIRSPASLVHSQQT